MAVCVYKHEIIFSKSYYLIYYIFSIYLGLDSHVVLIYWVQNVVHGLLMLLMDKYVKCESVAKCVDISVRVAIIKCESVANRSKL